MGIALSKSPNFSEPQIFLRVSLIGLIRESVDTIDILNAFFPFLFNSATILSVYCILGTLQGTEDEKHRTYSHAYNLIAETEKKTTDNNS